VQGSCVMLHHPETDSDLDTLIASHDVVLVDFFATWCGPCKAVAPAFEALSEQHTSVAFVKIDVDQNQESSQRYQIRAMPTFVFFKGGSEFKRIQGANLPEIEKILEEVGGAGAQAVDVRSLSVKQLKEALQDRKVSLTGCVEKKDLQERLVVSLKQSELLAFLKLAGETIDPKAVHDRDDLVAKAKQYL